VSTFQAGGVNIQGGQSFDNPSALLSEGGPLAVVVDSFPETPHQTRDNTDFPHPLRKSEARLRLAGPPVPGATARRTRGVYSDAWWEGHQAG